MTTFQYSTGINSWLISAVLYPTGGKTTYSYGNAPVGTELKTYYVTARNIYSSSTALSQSSSINYKIINGNVIWANATTSNGSTNQSKQDYDFLSSKNLMRLYDENGTGTLTRITEYDYNYQGQINDTKTSSSLAYGITGYWPLDEGSGSTTSDASGRGITGTLVNSPTWESGTNCKYGNCLSFASSSDQYVSFGQVSLSTAGDSYSLWVSFASTTGTQAMLSVDAQPSSAGPFLALYVSGTGLVSVLGQRCLQCLCELHPNDKHLVSDFLHLQQHEGSQHIRGRRPCRHPV